MRLLLVGGTVFLGRHVAEEALARGHDVTVLHRGLHGRDLWAGAVEHLLGDRRDPAVLERVAARRWDAVIDTCGFAGADVAALCAAIASSGAHYVFVASVNVHPGWPAGAVTEDSAVHTDDADPDYGAQKAAAERAAIATLGAARVFSARAGLVVGPYDNIFRLPWWMRRIAEGGDVLAPGDPARRLQLIDARDLAAFLLDAAEQRTAGLLSATGPAGQVGFAELLGMSREATGSDARLHWAPDELLLDAGVAPWTELPLWLPADAGGAGTWAVDTRGAQAAGLRCRPVADTVADVWTWLRDGGEAALGTWRTEHRAPGLAPEREAALLRRLAAHRSASGTSRRSLGASGRSRW